MKKPERTVRVGFYGSLLGRVRMEFVSSSRSAGRRSLSIESCGGCVSLTLTTKSSAPEWQQIREILQDLSLRAGAFVQDVKRHSG